MQFDDHLVTGYAPAVFDGPAADPVPHDDADPLTGPGARIEICDTDDDGRADTVAITRPDEGTALFTDVDDDGRVDVATEISADGVVTVSEHLGDGHWTAVDHSRIGVEGAPERGPAAADDGSAGWNTAGLNSAGPDSAGPDSAGADSAGADSAGADSAGLDSVGFNSSGGSAGAGAGAGTGLADVRPVVIDPATGEWTEI